MKIAKENGQNYLTFKGFKIPVTRIDLIKLRNFINQMVNEIEE